MLALRSSFWRFFVGIPIADELQTPSSRARQPDDLRSPFERRAGDNLGVEHHLAGQTTRLMRRRQIEIQRALEACIRGLQPRSARRTSVSLGVHAEHQDRGFRKTLSRICRRTSPLVPGIATVHHDYRAAVARRPAESPVAIALASPTTEIGWIVLEKCVESPVETEAVVVGRKNGNRGCP